MEEQSIISGGEAKPPLFQQKQGESIDDARRLKRLLDRVAALMRDGRPRTLRQIADHCGGSEASCSARLRELRAQGWEVTKQCHRKGLYLYAVTGCPDDRGPT